MQAVFKPCRAKVTAVFVPPPPVAKTTFLISIFTPDGKHNPSPVTNCLPSTIVKSDVFKNTSLDADPIVITSKSFIALWQIVPLRHRIKFLLEFLLLLGLPGLRTFLRGTICLHLIF